MRGAVWEIFDIGSRGFPHASGTSVHEQLAKWFRGARKIEQVARLQEAKYLTRKDGYMLGIIYDKTRNSFSYLHEDVERHTGHILQPASLTSKIPTTALLLWSNLGWDCGIVALAVELDLLSRRHTE